MPYISATVTRWVDESFPGWVEVEFVESDGTTVTLIDKAAVFGISEQAARALSPPNCGVRC